MEEKTIRLQVGRYDFLGLLIPSLILVTSVISVLIVIHKKDLEWVMAILRADRPYQLIAILTTILLATYIVGHVIDGFGIFLYERFLVQKLHGYPYERLLLLTKADPEYQVRGTHYRSIAFSGILTTLAWTCHSYYGTWSSQAVTWLVSGLFAVSLFWKLGRSSSFARWLYPRQSGEEFLAARRRHERRIFAHSPFGICAAMYRAAENLVRHTLGLDRAFSAEFLELFRKKLMASFSVSLNGLSTDLYWLVYFSVMENHLHSRERINRHLNEAVFSRNTSVAFLCSGVVLNMAIAGRDVGGQNSLHFFLAALACYLLSALMLARYYFAYTFFTKLVFRAFVAHPVMPRVQEQ